MFVDRTDSRLNWVSFSHQNMCYFSRKLPTTETFLQPLAKQLFDLHARVSNNSDWIYRPRFELIGISNGIIEAKKS